MNKNYPKIVIAGDGGVGKSTLLSTCITGKFENTSPLTIGVNFNIVSTQNKREGAPKKFCVFDLGGQPRFHFMHNSFIKGAQGAIVIYDLTRKKSFENVFKWINIIDKECGNIPLLICASKKDLAQSEDIAYFRNEFDKNIQRCEKIYNIIGHKSISSKNQENIQNLFLSLSEVLSENILH